jgi:hypothetical protein
MPNKKQGLRLKETEKRPACDIVIAENTGSKQRETADLEYNV